MTRHKDNNCQIEGCDNGCWRDVCTSCAKRIRYGSLPEQFGITHNPPCALEGCNEPRYTTKGLYCRGHYGKSLAGENPKSKRVKRKNHAPAPECSVSGCGLPANAKGKCVTHRRRELTPPKRRDCSVSGCEVKNLLAERCAKHRKQYDKYGITWTGKRPNEQIRKLREATYGTCSVLGCERTETGLDTGICRTHNADRARKNASRKFYFEIMSREFCESCGDKGRLVVDHDHSCHAGDRMCESCIRGRLCNGCNTALGYVNESAERLRRLAEYIERFK